ncbi:nucleotidyltransferase family protein [Flavicella sediminum]|uniref:nucleotidyltransferase family protein n=1 Tax=Flavicella sediminum TaxID=2585141 RepID=UPI00111E2D8D|nr:sugar phosphate nucleotidyltransferase [Flavicella sediminum]
MKEHTLVILAAGMGSRYGGLKQLDKMSDDGDTIIDFSLFDAIEAGFKKVVFIIRESFKEDFKKIYDERLKGKVQVEYVCQEIEKIPAGYKVSPERVKPWGTGHATLMIKDVVDGNFIVINGDDFYSKGAFKTIIKALDALDVDSYNMCMVGYNLKNTLSDNGYVSRGECFVNENMELTNIIERTHIEEIDGVIKRQDEAGNLETMAEDTIVSMNFWGFTPKYLEALEEGFKSFLAERSTELKSEFYIPTVVNSIIESGKGSVKVLTSDAKWMGVTYAEDRPVVVGEVNRLKKENIYPRNLWQ